jgi:hypothetical protein
MVPASQAVKQKNFFRKCGPTVKGEDPGESHVHELVHSEHQPLNYSVEAISSSKS